MIDLIVPKLGSTNQHPIRVSQWLVKPGATVGLGDDLVELLLDAATIHVSAPTNGRLAETLVSAGDSVVEGQTLGRIERTN